MATNVDQPTRRIGHGKRTTVSGLLEQADGTALGDQTVQVLSSPNDNAPRCAWPPAGALAAWLPARAPEWQGAQRRPGAPG